MKVLQDKFAIKMFRQTRYRLSIVICFEQLKVIKKHNVSQSLRIKGFYMLPADIKGLDKYWVTKQIIFSKWSNNSKGD